MLRAACDHLPAHFTSRALPTVLAVLLLMSIDGVMPRPAEAGDAGDIIAAIRQRQLRAENTMRRADQQIRRLQRQRSAHARQLHQTRRRLDRALGRRERARQRTVRVRQSLTTERAVRDRKLRVHPNPSGLQLADRPKLRQRVTRLQARSDRLERSTARLTRKVQQARKQRQARSRGIGRARIDARKGARERAEAVLGERISQMLALSKERAAVHTSAGLRRGFMRPARGPISQGYGCQRVDRGKDDRRSCLSFHDGIDIAAPRGTRVRASADGYVAYVGWNPWDGGRRSFVVIIGHARGIETIYAHLAPSRMVMAGQRVRRGQVVGVVGMTGRTSGAHVHWEVSRDFQAMDPLRAGR